MTAHQGCTTSVCCTISLYLSRFVLSAQAKLVPPPPSPSPPAVVLHLRQMLLSCTDCIVHQVGFVQHQCCCGYLRCALLTGTWPELDPNHLCVKHHSSVQSHFVGFHNHCMKCVLFWGIADTHTCVCRAHSPKILCQASHGAANWQHCVCAWRNFAFTC